MLMQLVDGCIYSVLATGCSCVCCEHVTRTKVREGERECGGRTARENVYRLLMRANQVCLSCRWEWRRGEGSRDLFANRLLFSPPTQLQFQLQPRSACSCMYIPHRVNSALIPATLCLYKPYCRRQYCSKKRIGHDSIGRHWTCRRIVNYSRPEERCPWLSHIITTRETFFLTISNKILNNIIR